mmetsp:Transcript_1163/g.4424  ORF Transcript_1163/g.4424 Transcript_1163/m.4424 type:complete len:224 (-) Transcript_1163:678-1349(-)
MSSFRFRLFRRPLQRRFVPRTVGRRFGRQKIQWQLSQTQFLAKTFRVAFYTNARSYLRSICASPQASQSRCQESSGRPHRRRNKRAAAPVSSPPFRGHSVFPCHPRCSRKAAKKSRFYATPTFAVPQSQAFVASVSLKTPSPRRPRTRFSVRLSRSTHRELAFFGERIPTQERIRSTRPPRSRRPPRRSRRASFFSQTDSPGPPRAETLSSFQTGSSSDTGNT